MPRGNGTGPMGMGPMTGRAAGFCAGFNMPGYMNQLSGRGFGMGFGRGGGFGGGGFRNRFNATGMTGWQREAAVMPEMNREQEIATLKNQAKYLQESLEAVQKQLKGLETDKN